MIATGGADRGSGTVAVAVIVYGRHRLRSPRIGAPRRTHTHTHERRRPKSREETRAATVYHVRLFLLFPFFLKNVYFHLQWRTVRHPTGNLFVRGGIAYYLLYTHNDDTFSQPETCALVLYVNFATKNAFVVYLYAYTAAVGQITLVITMFVYYFLM